jgi:hypothetical protein
MEEWTGFELSEQVLEEAGQWISALEEIESAELNGLYHLPAGALVQTNSNQKTLESFNQWLSANPQHQQAYAEMSLLWAKSACINEISDRLCASNVFALPQFDNLSNSVKDGNAILSIEGFKQKPLPILLPYSQNSHQNESSGAQSSPAWAYMLSIGLIFVGLLSPFLQQIL